MSLFSQLFNPSGIHQLDPDQVHNLIGQSPRPYLLDVRTPDEYKRGHINGAELIPLNELPDKLARIPKERAIVCVCESGSRSSVATRLLTAQGYEASNMRGGMSLWTRAGLPVKTGMAR